MSDCEKRISRLVVVGDEVDGTPFDTKYHFVTHLPNNVMTGSDRENFENEREFDNARLATLMALTDTAGIALGNNLGGYRPVDIVVARGTEDKMGVREIRDTFRMNGMQVSVFGVENKPCPHANSKGSLCVTCVDSRLNRSNTGASKYVTHPGGWTFLEPRMKEILENGGAGHHVTHLDRVAREAMRQGWIVGQLRAHLGTCGGWTEIEKISGTRINGTANVIAILERTRAAMARFYPSLVDTNCRLLLDDPRDAGMGTYNLDDENERREAGYAAAA